ncbi:MAG: hypothetical protein R3200_10675 [Xanthomonadales bacterium]|nr:hypothetical protein [Xanthomonadales bacterium]
MKQVAKLLIILWAGLGAAQDFRPEILLTPEIEGEPRELAVVGIWPDGCVPAITEVQEGPEIVITTRHGGAACEPGPTRYTLAAVLGASGPLADGIYPVRVLSSGPEERLKRLIGFDLIRIGEPAESFRPETGIWWPVSEGSNPTAGPGIGFAIESQERAMVLLANMYDALGSPMWMIGTGTLSGRLLRTDLLSFSGGQPLFTRYAPPDGVNRQARGYLQFHSRSEATLWVSAPREQRVGAELLLHPISLARYNFGHATGVFAFAGTWTLVHGEKAATLRLAPDLMRRGSRPGLVDQALGLRLSCEQSQAGGVATRCELLDTDNEVWAVFDDIGLNRLYGVHADGEPVRAFRME